MTDRPAFVLLEDGTLYRGTVPSAIRASFGEVVFTTNLTGYQEAFTDPSYLGQILVMTAPMIGNYGVTREDMESDRPQVAGVVVRELSRRHSNWRATEALGAWLSEYGIPVLEGVDTRRLTRYIRERGAMRGVLAEGAEPSAQLKADLESWPAMSGLDLASRASVAAPWTSGREGPHIVAYDFGIKRSIVRRLVDHECRVTVVPVPLKRPRRPGSGGVCSGDGSEAMCHRATDLRYLLGAPALGARLRGADRQTAVWPSRGKSSGP